MISGEDFTDDEVIGTLLIKMSSSNLEINQRRNAIADLALLIEKNSGGAHRDSVYQELLGPELLARSLVDSEKSKIVESICKQLSVEPAGSGLLKELFWALGKTEAFMSVRALHSIAESLTYRDLNSVEVRQALLSIDDLSHSATNNDLTPILSALAGLRLRLQAPSDDENLRILDGYYSKISKRSIPGI